MAAKSKVSAAKATPLPSNKDIGRVRVIVNSILSIVSQALSLFRGN